MLFYRLPVLYLAGRIDRLSCFGKYDASRVHTPMLSSLHGAKASISVLPILFPSFRYSRIFRSISEQIQSLSEAHSTKLLWSWHGHLMLNHPCIGFQPPHCQRWLTVSSRFGFDQAIPWMINPLHPKPELGLLSWGTKMCAPGSNTVILHESAGYSSKFDNPMLSVGVRSPSSSDVFHLSNLLWESC